MINARNTAKHVTWSVDGGNQGDGHSSAAFSCPGALSAGPTAHQQLKPAAESGLASSVQLLYTGDSPGRAQLAEAVCTGSWGQGVYVQCCKGADSMSLVGAGQHVKTEPLSSCTSKSTDVLCQGITLSQQQPSAALAFAAVEVVPVENTLSLLSLDNSLPSIDTCDSNSRQHTATPAVTNQEVCGSMLPAASHCSAAVPVIAAAAAASLAACEAPWTQNTARALRRAQQEVKELFVAQGLAPSAEKPCCFDLVGTRAAGIAAGAGCSVAATAQLQRDWPVIEGLLMASRSPAALSSNGGADSGQVSSSGDVCSGDGTVTSLSSQGMAPILRHQGTNAGFPGPAVDSPASCHTPNTPASPAAQLLLELQQRRGQFSTNPGNPAELQTGRQRAASAGQQASGEQHPQQHLVGKLGSTQHCKQPWDDLFTRHHLAKPLPQTPGAAVSSWCTATAHGSRREPVVQKHTSKQAEGARSRVLQLDAALMDGAEHSIALHSFMLKNQCAHSDSHSPAARSWAASECCSSCKPRDSQIHGQLQGEIQQSASPGLLHMRRKTSADAGYNRIAKSVPSVLCNLPDKWWTTPDRPLSDPLLLAMPVWMRDALDLELMPL